MITLALLIGLSALATDDRECIPMHDIEAAGQVASLTPDQFQFIRGLYAGLPPTSHTLPTGDHAILITSGGDAIIALIDDDQACARFAAPPALLEMLRQVRDGRINHHGQSS